VAEQARVAAMQVKGITGIFSSIGGGSSGDAFAPGASAEARRAVLTLTTVHRTTARNRWTRSNAQIRTKLDQIPGAKFTVGPQDTGVKMQMVLRSEDPVALTRPRGGGARPAHAQGHRQRQFKRLAGAPGDHRAAGLRQGRRPGRDRRTRSARPCAWPPPATTTPR
jgi:hypothetical protein